MVYEIKALRFAYPGGGEVLRGASLEIAEGDMLNLLGPNGAGKSTLFSCMMGLLKPQSGEILLDGRDVAAMTEREIARLVSFVPQNHRPMFGYSVLEFVLMGRAPLISPLGRPGEADRAAAMEALNKMELSALAERPYTELSGGEMQQVTIARAIVRKPRVILFDEPTAHLDMGNQLRTLRVIKELSAEGYTVAASTHNPDHAILLGGRTAIMDRDGGLLVGDTGEILSEDTLSKVYKADLRLRYIDELSRRACLFPNL